MEEDDIVTDLTNEAPKDIQRVSKDTVNKILSAQVMFILHKLINSSSILLKLKFLKGNIKCWNCCKGID